VVSISRGDNARRFILQQPLLYSETAYNYRRLGELWYQLMHSGINIYLKYSINLIVIIFFA
jgi:hypothetical protein